MTQQASAAKDWCITWNNPDVTDDVFEYQLSQLGVKYAVYQHEIGETGTPHIQAYIELNAKKRFTAIKKVLPKVHLEKRERTRDAARQYCMKLESRKPNSEPKEIGIWEEAGGQGKRTDLLGAISVLKEGGGLKRIREEYPEVYVKYHRGLEKMAMLEMQDRVEAPDVELYYGPPGCGKTRLARTHEDQETLWMTGLGDGTWFDGYEGNDIAVMDDFDGKFSCTKLHDLLRLIDRYAIRVPIKGSFVLWEPRVIRITTNIHPSRWYEWEGREEQRGALRRRFTRIFHWRRDAADPIIFRRGDACDDAWWKGPKTGQAGGIAPELNREHVNNEYDAFNYFNVIEYMDI